MLVVDRWVKRAAGWLAVLSAVSVIAIMVVMLADITTRTWVTGRSIPGAYELIETIVVLVLAFGVTQAEQVKANPRVTLITDALKPKPAMIVRTVGEFMMMLMGVWFAFGTTRDAIGAVQRHEQTASGIVSFPIWPTKVMLAVGFVLLALYLVNDIVRSIVRLTRNDIVIPEESQHAAI